MRGAAALAALLLAACQQAPDPVPAGQGFRDRAVPISSTTRGSPEDIAGEWVVAQTLAQDALIRPGVTVTIAEEAGAWLWTLAGASSRLQLARAVTLPGRYVAAGTGGPAQDLWVLWVDDDFRTMVVGTPDGSIGWILNRPGQASADRTRAAREILDFNGYDPDDFVG